MKLRICILLMLTACWGGSVTAHDIGVTQSELIELGDERYELRARVGGPVAGLFAPPQLPEHCSYSGSPRGIQRGGWRTFQFACEGPLTAADSLILSWRRDGIMLTAYWQDGTQVQQLLRNNRGEIVVSLAALKASSGTWYDAATRYGALGVEHILLGIDHLLFVLCLLLLVQGTWPLIKTITAFTIAHSITLGLATLGFVNVPQQPIEAVIALSIVFLAVEVVHARQGRQGLTYRRPWIVAFAFGLLHGLGFAGALRDVGLAQSEIPIALLFFNLGVEVGQLAFVFAVLLALRSLQVLEVRLNPVAQLAPIYLIGAVASYWLIERLNGIVRVV
jgi:hypothetical protein